MFDIDPTSTSLFETWAGRITTFISVIAGAAGLIWGWKKSSKEDKKLGVDVIKAQYEVAETLFAQAERALKAQEERIKSQEERIKRLEEGAERDREELRRLRDIEDRSFLDKLASERREAEWKSREKELMDEIERLRRAK